jgi:hypothetical protein
MMSFEAKGGAKQLMKIYFTNSTFKKGGSKLTVYTLLWKNG